MQDSKIKIILYLHSNFYTVLELIIRYISFLVVIYVYFDHAGSSFHVFVICLIYSNPLMFIQIAYPNVFGNLIDCICESSFLLYIGVWLAYTDKESNIMKGKKRTKTLFIFKLGLGASIYLAHLLKILHVSLPIAYLDYILVGIAFIFLF